METRLYHRRYNGGVKRRRFVLLLGTLPLLADGQKTVLRGRLVQDPLKPPALRTTDGKIVELLGDEATIGVLRDRRLKDDDFEVLGEFIGPAKFRVAPIHERALWVYQGGKRLVITYWCDTCGIRTYTPGICECCQEETALDPRDPAL
jgi:hypothetical protein